jgi:hypothetical protein
MLFYVYTYLSRKTLWKRLYPSTLLKYSFNLNDDSPLLSENVSSCALFSLYCCLKQASFSLVYTSRKSPHSQCLSTQLHALSPGLQDWVSNVPIWSHFQSVQKHFNGALISQKKKYLNFLQDLRNLCYLNPNFSHCVVYRLSKLNAWIL